MIEVVHTAIDSGIQMFDTAEVYGFYTNEKLVGKTLAVKRNQVQIATKGVFKIDGLKNQLNSCTKTIISAVEDSLKRLKTDYIDLYYIHGINPNTPTNRRSCANDPKIQTEREILHWRLSEAATKTIRKAHVNSS